MQPSLGLGGRKSTVGLGFGLVLSEFGFQGGGIRFWVSLVWDMAFGIVSHGT